MMFDRSDHLGRVAHPEWYILVQDLVVHNVKLKRVLIDGGSTLNILFTKTLDKMQIPRSKMKSSSAPFHRVVPMISSMLLGQISLPVTFGLGIISRQNICFEVADFEAAYYAILGRPALAKFVVVPYYTYLMLKMPSQQRVISLRSDVKQAVTSDKESCEMTQSHGRALDQQEV